MLEPEILAIRSELLQKIRGFFINHSYIELDTPSMSPALLPDCSREVFKAAYIDPWTDEEKNVFLGPSHEYFLKKVLAATKAPVFQLSKCFANCISAGRLNSPEFTQLEVYTPGTAYTDSAVLTENLFLHLLSDASAIHRPPFIRLSLDEAFGKYAGFPLSNCRTSRELAEKICQLGIPEFSDNPFDDWSMDELFELLLTQIIEPALPKDSGVFLFDWPSYVPCLAKEKSDIKGKASFWKERWSLYLAGTQIAVSRSEETDARKVRKYIESEGRLQKAAARVPPAIDDDFWKTFTSFPECSGIELNVDRLIMFLTGKSSIEQVIAFPYRLKKGYY